MFHLAMSRSDSASDIGAKWYIYILTTKMFWKARGDCLSRSGSVSGLLCNCNLLGFFPGMSRPLASLGEFFDLKNGFILKLAVCLDNEICSHLWCSENHKESPLTTNGLSTLVLFYYYLNLILQSMEYVRGSWIQGFNCLIYCLVVLKYCLIETLLNLFSLEVDPSCRLCSKPSFFNRVTRKRTHLCLLFASLALSVSLDIPLLWSHSFLFCPFSNSWPL